MTTIRYLLLVLTSLLVFNVQAQQTPVQIADLQQQMNAEEFKAAGLDKLSAEELSRLNAWLQRKVVTETATAVAIATEVAKEEGRKEVVKENRGFFDFGTSEPIESHIVGEFKGFAKGRKYTLANGQIWEQVEEASLPGVRKTDLG